VLALIAVAATVTTAAIAGAGTASADVASASVRCLRVSAPVLRNLRSGLRASVRPKLRGARAVKARGDFSAAPRGFSHGVYFVSANLRGRGIATWAVSTSVLHNAGGLIYAVGKLARRISIYGADVPPSVLAGWGISTRTYGYTQSRGCVR
jgi:hypothetical protein